MTMHCSAPAGARSTAAVRQLVGNTPMLEILYRLDGRERRLYAKYESMNMTGSVKDRMACHILAEAYTRGQLTVGDTIVEASSGSPLHAPETPRSGKAKLNLPLAAVLYRIRNES